MTLSDIDRERLRLWRSRAPRPNISRLSDAWRICAKPHALKIEGLRLADPARTILHIARHPRQKLNDKKWQRRKWRSDARAQ